MINVTEEIPLSNPSLNSAYSDDLLLTCKYNKWILEDTVEEPQKKLLMPPLAGFNHLAREVLDLEKSKKFYVDILGFYLIPRPPFEAKGYWLYGNNIMIHLVQTEMPEARRQLKISRIQHVTASLPIADHLAFLTTDFSAVIEVLNAENVWYKYFEQPDLTGIQQIFLFDPDGNVIEISNCAPAIGEIKCAKSDLHKADEEERVEDESSPRTQNESSPRSQDESSPRSHASSEDTVATDLSTLSFDEI
jgi:catechol 2,3-dioxygenase-like lactoylglutathione lyase family enzyme